MIHFNICWLMVHGDVVVQSALCIRNAMFNAMLWDWPVFTGFDIYGEL